MSAQEKLLGEALATLIDTVDKIRAALDPDKLAAEPSEDRVERVARAILHQMGSASYERAPDHWLSPSDAASARNLCTNAARAAIGAMHQEPDDAAVERVARALCLIGGNDPDETKFTDGKPVWTAYAHPARAAIIAFERRHA